MATKRILTFGNPVFDLILTPQIVRNERVLSGCSTNACLAVSKLGEESFLIGTVGPDFLARMTNELDSRRIEHNLLPSLQTGGFSLIYDERGDRELIVLGIADPIPANADGFGKVDFVLLGPILGEISTDLVQNLKHLTDAPILLDPQGLLRRIKGNSIVHEVSKEFIEIAKLSTVVKANEIETLTVTGIDPRKDPEGSVRALYETGCRIAVVTLAEAGSVIFDGKKVFRIPPYTTNAIDPTGAGDTYAAGFMVKYLETPDDLTQVGCFASCVSSVMVENSGPEFPLTRAEADRRAKILLDGPIDIKL